MPIIKYKQKDYGSGGDEYELPIASDSVLGGIKVDNITTFVNEEGFLFVTETMKKIMAIPNTDDNFTYDNSVHTPIWNNYDEDILTIGGTTSAVNAGTYATTFTPKEKYIWNDGTTKLKSVSWSIKGISLPIPSKKSNPTYNGEQQSPEWENYNSEKIIIEGTTSATEIGTYTVTFTPKENYQWSDGATTPISIEWSIEKVVVDLPTQNRTLTYSGDELSPIWNNYDDTKLTISGIIVGVNAGTYTAEFTPKEGCMWSDKTIETKTVNWTISRANITSVPSQSGSLTYTGSEQSPTWNDYDSNKMTVGGTTGGTNASTYTATFTPKSNYQWSDGTFSSKNVSWSIGKALGSLSLSKTSATLNMSTLSTTATVTRSGDGVITATSSNTSIATVNVSGTTITITAKGNGTATITVKVASGTNYTSPTNKTISVTVSGLASSVLGNNTPEQIKKTIEAGLAPNLWSVGDKIGIKLNGTVGDITFNNETYYAIIIGFNHNSSIEGNNSIHFQFGKDSSGADIAFCDNNYNNTFATGFIMNVNSFVNGWSDSYMRNTICPAFLAALPTEWQNIIVSCTKYSDNKGSASNTSSYVTATSDKIWLLSEFELCGTRINANSAEKNYQQQYDYYKNGNSTNKYSHLNLQRNYYCAYHLRSVSKKYMYQFCYSNGNSGVNSGNQNISRGFVPCFMVA